ncbi:hypothetical protein I3843_13G102500 [Carya illinoinensis]|nr:hypothetical protein I3843_13G102500 [Carya illinoinensis]
MKLCVGPVYISLSNSHSLHCFHSCELYVADRGFLFLCRNLTRLPFRTVSVAGI